VKSAAECGSVYTVDQRYLFKSAVNGEGEEGRGCKAINNGGFTRISSDHFLEEL
jgi:hypothetical protein